MNVFFLGRKIYLTVNRILLKYPGNLLLFHDFELKSAIYRVKISKNVSFWLISFKFHCNCQIWVIGAMRSFFINCHSTPPSIGRKLLWHVSPAISVVQTFVSLGIIKGAPSDNAERQKGEWVRGSGEVNIIILRYNSLF